MKPPALPFGPHTLVVAGDEGFAEMIRRGQRKDARGMRGVTAEVLNEGAQDDQGRLWLALSFPPARFADVTRACEGYRGMLPASAVIHEYMLCLCCGGFEEWPRPVQGLLRALH